MRKTTGILVVLLAIVSFAFIKPNAETKKITVVIDAGHGGNDHGAKVNDVTEKEIVQQITNKIKSQNNNQDIQIMLTRDTDATMTFDDRTKIINSLKPDLVISLHVNNQKNPTANGMEFYVSKNNIAYEKSNTHAQQLQQKFQVMGMKSRGIKEASFMMLKKSEAPTVLVELGFLSNHSDRKYLTDDNGQNRIASTILEFISEIK